MKRYCIEDINEKLLRLARLHIKKYSSADDDFWIREKGTELYGLRSHFWEYSWKKRHRAQIYMKLSDAICNTLRLPSDTELKAFLALAPSYERYYPRYWCLMEAINVNINIDGVFNTVKRVSLGKNFEDHLLRNHSLNELREMHDELAGIEIGILLEGL